MVGGEHDLGGEKPGESIEREKNGQRPGPARSELAVREEIVSGDNADIG